jgi:hypothetical protein
MARHLGLNGHYLESSRGQLSAGIEVPGFSDFGIINSPALIEASFSSILEWKFAIAARTLPGAVENHLPRTT